MNEQYVKWLNSKDHGIWPTTREYEFGEKAFIAGLESAKPEKRFGNKQREKWWSGNKDSLFSPDKMDFDKIWNAAVGSTKEPQFGCHVDWRSPKMKKRDWEIYPTCCIDYGKPDDCNMAETVGSKDECPFWKVIEECNNG